MQVATGNHNKDKLETSCNKKETTRKPFALFAGNGI